MKRNYIILIAVFSSLSISIFIVLFASYLKVSQKNKEFIKLLDSRAVQSIKKNTFSGSPLQKDDRKIAFIRLADSQNVKYAASTQSSDLKNLMKAQESDKKEVLRLLDQFISEAHPEFYDITEKNLNIDESFLCKLGRCVFRTILYCKYRKFEEFMCAQADKKNLKMIIIDCHEKTITAGVFTETNKQIELKKSVICEMDRFLDAICHFCNKLVLYKNKKTHKRRRN